MKIRYADFSTLTKRKTLDQQTQDSEEIAQSIIQLYETLSDKDKGVRLFRSHCDRILKTLKESTLKVFFLYKIIEQSYKVVTHYQGQYGIYQTL